MSGELRDEELARQTDAVLWAQAGAIGVTQEEARRRVVAARRRAQSRLPSERVAFLRGLEPLAGTRARILVLVILAIIVVAALLAGGYFQGRFAGNPPMPDPTPPELPAPAVLDAGLLDSTTGWALTSDALLATSDLGASWRRIGPADVAVSAIRKVTFLDGRHGWIVSRLPGTPALRIDRTVDGGEHWTAVRLEASNTGLSAPAEAGVSIQFVDATTGWLQADQLRIAALFRTDDAGATWNVVSERVVDDVTFVSRTHGWSVPWRLAGIDETNDGGVTWQVREIPLPPDLPARRTGLEPPVFFGPDSGVLPVVVAGADLATVQTLFLTTSDGGRSWNPSGRTAPISSTGRAIAGHAFIGPSTWLYPSANRRLLLTEDAGATWHEIDPQGLDWLDLRDLQFATTTTGWSIADACTGCPGARTALVVTRDGGRTWTFAHVGAADAT